ncbi:MAG: AAA family ATPase [Alphaproteobacteria bacterium]
MTHSIAITSAKSGLGKTFIATSLAFALAYIKNKVLFFDASLGADNINEQLNLNLSEELPLVLANKKTLNQIIIKNSKPSFDIISSYGGIFKLIDIPVGITNILLDDLKIISQNYDNLIIDMPSPHLINYDYSRLIILCNDEPSSVSKCFEIIKNNTDKKIDIVINFAPSHLEGKRVFENINKACQEYLKLKVNYLGTIRKDSRIKDALRNKSSIINRYPNSDASLDIFNIAKKIISQ